MQSRYCTALYFCFTALISVGFGNVAPNTDAEKLYAIVMMLLGCESSQPTSVSCFGWPPENKLLEFTLDVPSATTHLRHHNFTVFIRRCCEPVAHDSSPIYDVVTFDNFQLTQNIGAIQNC